MERSPDPVVLRARLIVAAIREAEVTHDLGYGDEALTVRRAKSNADERGVVVGPARQDADELDPNRT